MIDIHAVPPDIFVYIVLFMAILSVSVAGYLIRVTTYSTIEKLEAKCQKLEEQAETRKEAYNKAFEELKEHHSNEIAELKKEHSYEIAKLKHYHKTEIEKYKMENIAAREECKEQIRELAKQIDQLREKMNERE